MQHADSRSCREGAQSPCKGIVPSSTHPPALLYLFTCFPCATAPQHGLSSSSALSLYLLSLCYNTPAWFRGVGAEARKWMRQGQRLGDGSSLFQRPATYTCGEQRIETQCWVSWRLRRVSFCRTVHTKRVHRLKTFTQTTIKLGVKYVVPGEGIIGEMFVEHLSSLT